MQQEINPLLVLGAALSASAALLHYVCIAWGVNGFRVMGAGDRVVLLASQGHWYPNAIAFAVGSLLLVWSLFALSASGVGPNLPFAKWAVLGIATVYLARGLAFPWLKNIITGNSNAFWLVSSAICLILGVVHAVGLAQVWHSI